MNNVILTITPYFFNQFRSCENSDNNSQLNNSFHFHRNIYEKNTSLRQRSQKKSNTILKRHDCLLKKRKASRVYFASDQFCSF